MMCFKDKTWCRVSKLCGNKKCPRNLTKEEQKQAFKWWGNNDYPIAIADMKTEHCGFVEIKDV